MDGRESGGDLVQAHRPIPEAGSIIRSAGRGGEEMPVSPGWGSQQFLPGMPHGSPGEATLVRLQEEMAGQNDAEDGDQATDHKSGDTADVVPNFGASESAENPHVLDQYGRGNKGSKQDENNADPEREWSVACAFTVQNGSGEHR